jgi:hypothetical protein
MCNIDHLLKTTQNWQLVPGTGRRQLVPPGHPLHPDTLAAKGPPPEPAAEPQTTDLTARTDTDHLNGAASGRHAHEHGQQDLFDDTG